MLRLFVPRNRNIRNTAALAAATPARLTVAASAAVEQMESRTLLSGNGLAATYYNNADLTGSTASRVDAKVDFSWGTGSPTSAIGADTFSARWTGSVVPTKSETYTFYTNSDDGVRVWVDGRLAIDSWTPHESKVDVAPLAPGRHDIRVEYYQLRGWTELRVDILNGRQRSEGSPGPH